MLTLEETSPQNHAIQRVESMTKNPATRVDSEVEPCVNAELFALSCKAFPTQGDVLAPSVRTFFSNTRITTTLTAYFSYLS